MSPIDAARRLGVGPCPTYWDVELTGTVGRFGPDQGTVLKCAHCRQKLHEHGSDCPVLALPRIVAALEAAERTSAALVRLSPHYPREITSGPYAKEPGAPLLICDYSCCTWPCEIEQVREMAGPLLAALQGSEVTV